MPFLSLSFSGFSILVDVTVITGPSNELGVIPFLTALPFFRDGEVPVNPGVEGGAGMQCSPKRTALPVQVLRSLD